MDKQSYPLNEHFAHQVLIVAIETTFRGNIFRDNALDLFNYLRMLDEVSISFTLNIKDIGVVHKGMSFVIYKTQHGMIQSSLLNP